MDGFNYIEDHFETTVKPRILEQYKESGRWQACLEAVVKNLQVVEDSAFSISKVIDFKTETPTGAKLDWVAGLINVKRLSGESDQAFFLRFVSMCGANTAGTPDNVIYNTALLSGDTAPQYMDEAPATFFVYDGPIYEHRGDGDDVLVKPAATRQLLRREVKKLAPCGALGLPGAAIQLYDGTLLCTDDYEKLLIVAADDATAERETVLVNEGNVLLTTSQDSTVRVTLKGDVRYQTTPIHVDGVPGTIDGIRVKDLPDAQNDEGFFVRDSEAGGTVKVDKMDQATLDELWDTTEPEIDNDNG